MNILFEVKTNKYKSYYVMADDFNSAKRKTENFIAEEEKSRSILDSDGSLQIARRREDIEEVVSISQIANKIIS
jgi:hypothetical protein